ncbi:MAG: hypothetical protein ABI333_07995 [bacterium]
MRKISLLLGTMLALTGCWNFDGADPGQNGNNNSPYNGMVLSIPQSAEREVDLLFVIDNSGSMAGEQQTLRANFPALMAELRSMAGGLPSLHLGVTSTDLGTGMFQITRCEEMGGDAGALLTGACPNPTGAPYIIDVEPQSCEITKLPNGTCSTHNCGQANCSHENSTTLVMDAATGCPRCRNYQSETLEDVFSCVANVGTMGCGFEQPLESMYKALDYANTANSGFLRDDAFLAVVILTDEDDCSASTAQLFDNTQTDINSTLGPLTSYRCFEFGIACDINSRTHQGLRQNCVPREDAGALLHPVSRYVQFLASLKDPSMLVVAAIAGHVTPSSSGGGLNATIGLDESSQPKLQFSCTNTVDGAVPGIRVFNLVDAFNDVHDLVWAYTSICNSDYSDTLSGVGGKLSELMVSTCFPYPLDGCADVGKEFGVPLMPQTCAINQQCLAQCEVTDIFSRGTMSEQEYDVPPCLEILSSGARAPGNTDRTIAYANGHPNERDGMLPVPACWHINYQPLCPGSNFTEMIVSRQTDPPPRSFTQAQCLAIPQREELCNDLQDNDQDCYVDLEDPDCGY